MSETKTVISFNKPTPPWATWVFRTVFFVTLALSIWLAGTAKFSTGDKVEIMLIMKAVDVLVWGMAKGIGVKREDFDTDNPN